jgi:sialate O-acetylesterase
MKNHLAAMSCLFVVWSSAAIAAQPATSTQPSTRPFVPSMFADGMVLQRNATVPIWGFATPGSKVTVRFADQTAEATTDASGRWTARLPAMPGSHEPRTLIIASPGQEARTISDVLVGDVYLLTGQSNMSWPLRAGGDDKVLADANYPWLRVFMQATGKGAADQRNDDVLWGKWKVCTPETAGAVSGVGFHFARSLHEHVDVPIALVHAAVGGTRIESWIDLPSLKTIPTIAPYFDAVAKAELKHAEDKAAHLERLAAWEKTKEGRQPTIANMLGVDRERRPAALFNGLVSPLQPMALRGVIWYQGEGNASNNPTHYRGALRTLIDSWRRDFDQPELPFLIVQLPSYHDGKQWPGTREAQRFVAQSTPNVGLVVTLDIGDPTNLHPASKLWVGTRAARLARAMIYKQNIVATGPIAKSARYVGDNVVISFDHVGEGLRIGKADDTTTTGGVIGFEVSDAAGTFRAVPGRISAPGEVTLDNAAGATAVRYAWSAIPADANLRNSDLIPAATFLLDQIQPRP